MRVEGRITISRITSNEPRGSWVRLTLEDENSRVQFANMDIDFKQFACAITGLSRQPCEMDLAGLDLVGKKLERKEELVYVPKDLDRGDKDAIEGFLAQYESDGWRARRDDISNWHNRRDMQSDTQRECYEVSFTRYV